MNDKIIKTRPHSLEAERAILGAMIRDESALSSSIGDLDLLDFYLPAHRAIFTAMSDLYNNSKPVDEVTLVELLDKSNKLRDANGIEYVTDLRGYLPVLGNLEHYIKLVQEKSLLRKLIKVALEIQESAYEAEESSDEVLSEAEKKIFDISMQSYEGGLTKISDSVARSFVSIGEKAGINGITGLPTGFIDLDQKLSGLQKTDLIVIAGRPAMGKSSFAINIAQHAAIKDDAVVAVFSLEMSTDQLTTRMLCSEARVDMQSVKSGTLSGADWENLTQAMNKLNETNMYIDDSAGISLAEMRSKLRRLKVQLGKLDLVMIDYLQLMTYKGKANNRQQEVADMTRQLKIMAKELQVPILLLSQLSRGPETRESKRPMMSDLRESGAIEQDADIVILLFRQGVYDPDAGNVAQAIVAKHRNGPTGDVDLFWRGEYTMFENLQEDAPY